MGKGGTHLLHGGLKIHKALEKFQSIHFGTEHITGENVDSQVFLLNFTHLMDKRVHLACIFGFQLHKCDVRVVSNVLTFGAAVRRETFPSSAGILAAQIALGFLETFFVKMFIDRIVFGELGEAL